MTLLTLKAIELKMINYFNSFPQNKTIYMLSTKLNRMALFKKDYFNELSLVGYDLLVRLGSSLLFVFVMVHRHTLRRRTSGDLRTRHFNGVHLAHRININSCLIFSA